MEKGRGPLAPAFAGARCPALPARCPPARSRAPRWPVPAPRAGRRLRMTRARHPPRPRPQAPPGHAPPGREPPRPPSPPDPEPPGPPDPEPPGREPPGREPPGLKPLSPQSGRPPPQLPQQPATCSACGRDTSLARIAALIVTFIAATGSASRVAWSPIFHSPPSRRGWTTRRRPGRVKRCRGTTRPPALSSVTSCCYGAGRPSARWGPPSPSSRCR